MIFKNAEIHNVVDIDIGDGGELNAWYRMPKTLTNKFEIAAAADRNISSTGVEIRFVIKGPSATVRMQGIPENGRTNTGFHIFRGGVQGGYTDMVYYYVGAEPEDVVIKKAENIKTLKAISDEQEDGFDPEVIRIIFDRGRYRIIDIIGDIEPPKKGRTPEKTLMCYGSSITHGSLSLDMSHSWAACVARGLHMDIRNLGMAGSCAIEPDVIDYIASEGKQNRWDTLILEMGANVLSWPADRIRERVGYAITATAKPDPAKKIFAVSPIYGAADFYGSDKAVIWRRVMEETVSDLAFGNVTYINGLDLVDKISLLTADEVHPNIYGVEAMAKRLIDKINSTTKE